MLRSSKQNLYLLVLLATLSAGLIIINLISSNPHIIKLKPSEIESIVIETRDQPAIKIHKQNQSWQILESDKNTKANTDKIQLLLKLATADSLSQFEIEDSDLTKYDLSPPKLTVYFNDQAIHFGGLETINHLRYIQVNHTIHLIKDEFYRHLLANKDAFIEN